MNLKEQITAVEAEIVSATASSFEAVEAFRVDMLGRNGKVTALLDALKQVPSGEKREWGQRLNQLKNAARLRWEELKAASDTVSSKPAGSVGDLTRPALTEATGSLHPISIVRQRIVDVFARIGYTVSQGPEVEDDHHNFGALNFPPDHPARDMQDTFFVQELVTSGEVGQGQELALRTHTSSVQVRVMESGKPPNPYHLPGPRLSQRGHQCAGALHVPSGGRTLRGQRRQLRGTEGNTGPLRQEHLRRGCEEIRLRPSYFPFTEPSAEVDMSCTICGGAGCAVCKHSGWVEIMGCGMVDPAVLTNCGIDPEVYSGFAFGMGVERIAQLIYRVPDLRLYWENDVRFLEQFSDGAFRG